MLHVRAKRGVSLLPHHNSPIQYIMAYNSDRPGFNRGRGEQRGGARGASRGRSDRRGFDEGPRKHPFITDNWDDEDSFSRSEGRSGEQTRNRFDAGRRQERSLGSRYEGNRERDGRVERDRNFGRERENFRSRRDNAPYREDSGSRNFRSREDRPESNDGFRSRSGFQEERRSGFEKGGRTGRDDRSIRNGRQENSRRFNSERRDGSRSFSAGRGGRNEGGFRDMRRSGPDDFGFRRRRQADSGYNIARHTENESKKEEGYIRLNRYIANAGVCSRREADQMIASGVILVNGEVCTTLGTLVGPNDRVQFGGQTLNAEKKVYILMNKPKGYITTSDDPQERKTVMDLIQGACKERVYPVGRLDRNTTGVLLFTNDGDIAKRLTHPSHGARKIYHVTLDNPLAKADLAAISKGVMLEDGFVEIDEISYVESGDRKEVGVQIHSGRNRVVRRIFEKFGYVVVKLDRVLFAELTKKNLSRGQWRFLDEKEISFLKMNSGTKESKKVRKEVAPVFTEEQLAEAAAIEDAPVVEKAEKVRKPRKKHTEEDEWTGDEGFIQPRPSLEISDEELERIISSIDFEDEEDDD